MPEAEERVAKLMDDMHAVLGEAPHQPPALASYLASAAQLSEQPSVSATRAI